MLKERCIVPNLIEEIEVEPVDSELPPDTPRKPDFNLMMNKGTSYSTFFSSYMHYEREKRKGIFALHFYI